jgi:hypothetical protein
MYFKGLFRAYAKRSQARGSPGEGTIVSGWMNRESEEHLS